MTEEQKKEMITISDLICTLKMERLKLKTEILAKEQSIGEMASTFILDINNQKNSDGKPTFTNETARSSELTRRSASNSQYTLLQNEIQSTHEKIQELSIRIEKGERLFRINELFHLNKE